MANEGLMMALASDAARGTWEVGVAERFRVLERRFDELLALVERLQDAEEARRGPKGRLKSLEEERDHWKSLADERDHAFSELSQRCRSALKERDAALASLAALDRRHHTVMLNVDKAWTELARGRTLEGLPAPDADAIDLARRCLGNARSLK
jgi:chromosome segregation ATPase